MYFIWKPPALQILTCSIFAPLAILFCTLAFEPPKSVQSLVVAIAVLVYGGSVVVADVMHRRYERMRAFSMEQSTIFFIIPTWIIGVPIAVVGAVATLITLVAAIAGW